MAFAVPDLGQALADLVRRGLPRPDVEQVNEGARKATLTDPEGNVLAFIEVTPPAE